MIYLALVAAGLIFGSFANAVIWRIHEQAHAKTKKAKEQASILRGRSMCPHCRHELGPLDLIPVVSWLLLRGKCRYCGKNIDDNPLIELLLPALFVFSYLFWPYGFDRQGTVLFAFWLAFLTGFIILAVYDLRWYILPNKVLYPLIALAAIQAFLLAAVFNGGVSAIKDAIFGLAFGGGIFYLIFEVSKGKWIGGGDVKLGALLGLIVGGPVASLLFIFLASLLGTVAALPLLASKKLQANSRLPFGPFLIAGAIITYLFGASLISWYKRRFLIY